MGPHWPLVPERQHEPLNCTFSIRICLTLEPIAANENAPDPSKNSIIASGIDLYSADAGQRSHRPRSRRRVVHDERIHGDRHFLVLRFDHGGASPQRLCFGQVRLLIVCGLSIRPLTRSLRLEVVRLGFFSWCSVLPSPRQESGGSAGAAGGGD